MSNNISNHLTYTAISQYSVGLFLSPQIEIRAYAAVVAVYRPTSIVDLAANDVLKLSWSRYNRCQDSRHETETKTLKTLSRGGRHCLKIPTTPSVYLSVQLVARYQVNGSDVCRPRDMTLCDNRTYVRETRE